MKRISVLGLSLAVAAANGFVSDAHAQRRPDQKIPQVADPRLVVELFAAAPDIVHPIGVDFDSKGRLLVIESHTHFRPAGYKGPKHDRIRMLEDTDGDGKADRFTTFFEGTASTMDIAVHADGAVYLATRNEILRLRDTDGDGKADDKQRIVFLDTKGDYPHNGLSGLCFDGQGNLYFGMGENLGAAYKLIGADGMTITGAGDGGHIFWCTADGKKLRRVATGFWNPFGAGRDIFGRLFAVDNDPDSMPPCRLLHVVEGGDYGFQFRYGRAGRHPFQAWNGELPGTLPMMSGTGEAPCEVISYESDGLPTEYLGDLLVTSWADHRVERYVLKERGASFSAERKPFVQGGKDFHPVGLAVAPDGALYLSDWVLKDYNLHGHGAIWRIRSKEPRAAVRSGNPRQALFSAHRPLREKAARDLTSSQEGRDFLRQQLTNKNVRVRVVALMALLEHGEKLDLNGFAENDPEMGIRALAVRGLAARGSVAPSLHSHPVLKREALAAYKTKADVPRLVALLTDADPFVRHAAVMQLASLPDLLLAVDGKEVRDPVARQGLLLAWRASGRAQAARQVPVFLADADDDVRFLTAKWIADDKLVEHRPLVVEALKDRKLNVRLYRAYSTALARVDGQEVHEGKLADFFFARLADKESSPAARLLALQLVPAKHPSLTLDFLRKLVAQESPDLQLEAMRALAEHPHPQRASFLLDVVRDGMLDERVRAQAIVGLAEASKESLADLLALALKGQRGLRDEALRALVRAPLTAAQRGQLEELARSEPETHDLVARVLGKPFFQARPAAKDLDAWSKRLEGTADVAAGRRVFAHPRLASCMACHRIEGRGSEVGPDLSAIGRTERRHILESILQPSNLVAPSYQAWLVETADGRVRTGMLVNTHLDEYTYLDEKGGQFKVNTRDVVSNAPAANSIMPDGLADRLTDQELRDLMAYLGSRR